MLKKSPKMKSKVVQKIGTIENTQARTESDAQVRTSRIHKLGGDLDTYASRTLMGADIRDKLAAQMSEDDPKWVKDEKDQVPSGLDKKDEIRRTLVARTVAKSTWYDVTPIIKSNVQMQLSSSMFGANLTTPININFNSVSIGKGIPLYGMRIPNLRLDAHLHRKLQEDFNTVPPSAYTWWSEIDYDYDTSTGPDIQMSERAIRTRLEEMKVRLTDHIAFSVTACTQDKVFVDKWNSIAKNTSLAINSFDSHTLDPMWVRRQCENYAYAVVTFYAMMESARKADLSLTNFHACGFNLQVTDDCKTTLAVLDDVTDKAVRVLAAQIRDVARGREYAQVLPRASILQYFVPEYTAMVWWSNMMSGIEFSGFEVMRMFTEVETRRVMRLGMFSQFHEVDPDREDIVNAYYSLHSKVDGVDQVIRPKGASDFEMNLKTGNEKISRRQVDDPHCFVQHVKVLHHSDEERDYVMRIPNHVVVSPTIVVHGAQTATVGEKGLGLHIRKHLSPTCMIMTSAIIRNGCLHIEYGEGSVHAGYMQSDMVSVFQTLIPKLFADTNDVLRPNPIGSWSFCSQYREWRPKTRTIARSGQNYVYMTDLPQPVFLDVDSKCAHLFPMLLNPAFASRVITLYMDWYNKIVDKKITVIVENESWAVEDVIALSEKGKYYSCSRMLLLATMLNCSIGRINFDSYSSIRNDPPEGMELRLHTDGTTLWVKT
jgi:hypothetical protein